MTKTLGLLAAAAALFAAACSDPVAPAAPTPTQPSITDTFQGTLQVAGVNNHPFQVGVIGPVVVTVTSLDPQEPIGIAVGTPSGAVCSNLQSATVSKPGTTPQLTGSATITGGFCLSVFDKGQLTDPVTYTVSVLHP